MQISEEELMHYGVLGMKWGKRREARILNRTVKKDAATYAKSRMAYGKGAGIMRRHVDAQLKSKLKDPKYKKLFDEAVARVDYAKAKNQATRWRKGSDVKDQAKRTTKAAAMALTGTSSLAAAGILYSANKAAVDRVVLSTIKKFRDVIK